ncbi:MAG: PLP-dependent aminotransferase family protein [Thermoplasmata archaeon]
MGDRFQELFSQRARQMKASDIRELLKLVQQHDIISFAGGLPNPQAFPEEEIKEIVKDIMNNNAGVALQYGPTEGIKPLRQKIAERMERKGVKCEESDVLVVSGSQQALDIISKIFLNRKDIVITSAPSYLAGLSAFMSYEGNVEQTPMDSQGVLTDVLRDRIHAIHRHGGNIKFIYALPTFHNPAGVTMPEKRRKEMLDIAKDYDLLIVEDDPYSELRYVGTDIKPIKAFDDEGRVIYTSTFSKILTPGLRVGWIVADPEITRKLTIAKQATDLCTSTFNQYIAYEYLARGYIDKHIPKIKELYGRKMKIMLDAMKKYFPKSVKWTEPEGGMFLWCSLPNAGKTDTREMLKEALVEKVAFVPGSGFYVDGSGKNCMRLNFTHPRDEDIVVGVKRLAKVIEKELAKAKEYKFLDTTPIGV